MATATNISTARMMAMEQIKAVAKSMPEEISVWLYGSEARGEAKPHSDIDILVLSKNGRPTISDQQRLSAPLFDIELETGIQINPIFADETQWKKHRSIFTLNVNRDRIAL